MSKRLQVLLEDEELRQVQQAARLAEVSVAEWVRAALRAGRQVAAAGAPDRKLAVVRAAARHAFPTGEIGAMLAEIESGYGVEDEA
ncbi:MAG: antitoxin [Thermoanaerobaculia bacterium]